MAVDFVIGAIASAPASKQQLVISDIGRGYGQWIGNCGPRTVDNGHMRHWQQAVELCSTGVEGCMARVAGAAQNHSNNYNYKLVLALSVKCPFN